MKTMVERAVRAASQICGTVSSGRHVETLPTGEEVFRVGVVGHEREATVTLNPNGLCAGVDWQDGYRLYKLLGKI
jgi:hypothetical protein